MGSCAGSQCTTRKIHALGHEVRLIRAQFVNPYVKSKNIYITDTEAIAEAATRLATLESE
jgi:transposase